VEGEGLLVGDLVLPEQLHRFRLEDLLSCRRAGTLIQDRRKDLDVFLWLREQSSTTRLEELVLLVGAVLLQRMSVEVVAYTELARVWGSLMDLCEVGVYGGRREHSGAGCIDAKGREDMLFEVLPQLLIGDPLEDYTSPVKVDLWCVSTVESCVLTRELTPYSHVEPG